MRVTVVMGTRHLVIVEIVGPKGSGKSTFTCSLARLSIPTESLPTFPRRLYSYNNESFIFAFWDMPKADRPQSLDRPLRPAVRAFIYVFDQSSRDSFERVQSCRLAVQPPADQLSLSMLYGNPKGSYLAVSYEEAASYASSQGLVYMLGGAKNMEKAEEVIRVIARFTMSEVGGSRGSGD